MESYVEEKLEIFSSIRYFQIYFHKSFQSFETNLFLVATSLIKGKQIIKLSRINTLNDKGFFLNKKFIRPFSCIDGMKSIKDYRKCSRRLYWNKKKFRKIVHFVEMISRRLYSFSFLLIFPFNNSLYFFTFNIFRSICTFFS